MTAAQIKRFPLDLLDVVRDARTAERRGTPRPHAGASSQSLSTNCSERASGGGGPGLSNAAGTGVYRDIHEDSCYLPTPHHARAVSLWTGPQPALTSARIRQRMVKYLQAGGIKDTRVLAAMEAVPRHLFIDPALAAQAYQEAALPIGHCQTISKPSVIARMLELATAGRMLNKVLEIGTGCGYQAAVLGQLAHEVYSIERIRPLIERAKSNLRALRAPNIRLHYGDGHIGLTIAAPFDAIIIAAAGRSIPNALLDQLEVGGRLVAPIGGDEQVLMLIERVSATQWRRSRLERVFFVPLQSGVI